MENLKNVQKVVQKSVPMGQFNTFFTRNIRNLVFVAGLAAIGLLFNSCMAGYVQTEPAYVEYARPHPPSSNHIWISDDWHWNRMRHQYIQQPGYWDNPRDNQSYVSGYWQSTPRGKTWSKGHWQKEGQYTSRDNR